MKLSTKNIAIFCVSLILLASFYFLGFTGLRSIISFGLFFFLPAFILLSYTPLSNYENLFLSFTLGLGLFPMAVFYLNRIIPSLRITLAIVLIITLVLGFLKLRKNKQS